MLEQGGGFLVDEEARIWMGSETACGARTAHWSTEGVVDGFCFACAGDDDDEGFRGEEGGDGEGDGCFGNGIQVWETAVVDLLLAASVIQVHDPDSCGIVEIGGWVIESEVPVLSDPGAGDMDGTFGEELLVPGTFGYGVWGFAADTVECGGLDVLENVFLLVMPEAGGMCGVDPDVFVHVKNLYL